MGEVSSKQNTKSPRTGVKIAYMLLVWLLLAGLVLQVLLIGLGLFYDASFAGAHAGLGWMLAHMFGPIALIVGFFARIGRTLVILNIINLVLLLVLPVLAAMRAENGLVAGLHPVVALTVFALTFYTAGKIRSLIPTPWGSAPAAAPTALSAPAAAPAPRAPLTR